MVVIAPCWTQVGANPQGNCITIQSAIGVLKTQVGAVKPRSSEGAPPGFWPSKLASTT
jgi:hypothetical protein